MGRNYINKDLFGNYVEEEPVRINIFADEIQSKIDLSTKHEWHYVGLIVEDLNNSLLEDIINERFKNNFDINSPYYEKNNHIVHWSKIKSADEKNICKRWFNYILNPSKSGKKFYAYLLGLNFSLLSKKEFDNKNVFNSIYNRFFRTAIIYALKTFFGNKEIIVENIYHEEGQQKDHEYFPWHCIYKIKEREEKINFKCDKIEFLPKDHKQNEKSNLIQLCDAFMGACTSIINGFEQSSTSKYREELLQVLYPLVKRIIQEPNNKNSSFQHSNRIIVRFFPKENTTLDDLKRYMNQFFTSRSMYYESIISKQPELF